jgi:DNA polymerase-3 subunit delta'
MTWQGIYGHDAQVEQFRQAIARGRLASTFLFVGPPGIGKRTFALKLAQTLLCPMRPAEKMDPCGQCPMCRQVRAGSHPDLHVVRKPDDKNELPLALLIGDGDKRNREGLCHEIALRPFAGDRRVAIIDDADLLNVEGANSLLKTLEEPPAGAMMILISTALEKQLPTIRSRCQVVRFRPIPEPDLAELIVSTGITEDTAEAARLAAYSEGSLSVAKELADPELWAFRSTLIEGLSNPKFHGVALAGEVTRFVDGAGKEAPLRRARLRQTIHFAADFYRQALRAEAEAETTGDEVVARALTNFARRGFDADQIGRAIEVCAESLAQIDRFVHQATIIEGWLDGLARLQPDLKVRA